MKTSAITKVVWIALAGVSLNGSLVAAAQQYAATGNSGQYQSANDPMFNQQAQAQGQAWGTPPPTYNPNAYQPTTDRFANGSAQHPQSYPSSLPQYPTQYEPHNEYAPTQAVNYNRSYSGPGFGNQDNHNQGYQSQDYQQNQDYQNQGQFNRPNPPQGGQPNVGQNDFFNQTDSVRNQQQFNRNYTVPSQQPFQAGPYRPQMDNGVYRQGGGSAGGGPSCIVDGSGYGGFAGNGYGGNGYNAVAFDNGLATIANGWFIGGEALFFRYNRADGTRFGTSGVNEIVDFDFQLAPRITFGYLPLCAPGVRVRWFDFEDHAIGRVAGQGLGVDVRTLDLEMFRPQAINARWTVELSGGLRFADFRETMADGAGGNERRINDINAFGGIVGLESRHQACYGWFYGRARFAVLTGDKYHRNDNTPVELILRDTIVGMTEIGVGYEYQHDFCCRTGFVRCGAEWQMWHNFSTEFQNIAPAGENSGGPSDVGFAGLLFEMGFYY